jgi:hypothetical protein
MVLVVVITVLLMVVIVMVCYRDYGHGGCYRYHGLLS